MHKGRLEAFSDGVLAIIITIMVLEMKVPHGTGDILKDQPADLGPLLPVFLSYVLSFLYVGIYWNNHHHLFQVVKKISGGVLWANLHLLFWLSLFPFVTAWMGENHFTLWPVMLYGGVLFMAAVAYFLLTKSLLKCHDTGSHLDQALGSDRKGKVSLVLYAAGVALAFIHPWIGVALYVTVAGIWLIPDKRMERVIAE